MQNNAAKTDKIALLCSLTKWANADAGVETARNRAANAEQKDFRSALTRRATAKTAETNTWEGVSQNSLGACETSFPLFFKKRHVRHTVAKKYTNTPTTAHNATMREEKIEKHATITGKKRNRYPKTAKAYSSLKSPIS